MLVQVLAQVCLTPKFMVFPLWLSIFHVTINLQSPQNQLPKYLYTHTHTHTMNFFQFNLSNQDMEISDIVTHLSLALHAGSHKIQELSHTCCE